MNEEDLMKLPESIREWDEAKNSESPEIFWDRISNLRSKFGTGVFKPGEDAGTEDWGKFTNKVIELSGDRLMPRPDLEDAEQREALYRLLGKPTNVSEYEFAEVEGSTLSDERKEFISKIAFDLNLTKKQLTGLNQKIREGEVVSREQEADSFNNGLKDLKLDWGLAYDERIHAAKKIAATFFPHIGENPVLSANELKSFYSLAKQFGENGSEFKHQGDQSNPAMTPTEASEKISEIRNNKDHPYNNPRDPGHKLAKDKMRKLYLIKTGESEK